MEDNKVVSIVPRRTPELRADEMHEAIVRTYYRKNQRSFFFKKTGNKPLVYCMYLLERHEPGILGVEEIISLVEAMDKSYYESILADNDNEVKELDVTTLKECAIVLSNPNLPGRSFKTGYDQGEIEFIKLAMPELYKREIEPFENNVAPRYTISLVAQLLAAINKIGNKKFTSLSELIDKIAHNPESFDQKTTNLLIFFCAYSKRREEEIKEVQNMFDEMCSEA